MKPETCRKLAFIVALTIMASIRGWAQQMNLPDAPCKNAVVTVESANCLYDAWKKQDAELNRVYGKIIKKLDGDDLEKLRASQRLWVQFRDANCEAARSVYDGGTAVGPVFNGCLETMTRHRVEELKAMYVVVLKDDPLEGKQERAKGNCTVKDESSRPDCPRAIVFFQRFQAALKADDREAIASMVQYPLHVSILNRKQLIHDRGELLAQFDAIFNAGVKCSILEAQPDEVWGNWKGLTIANGVIWFDGIIPASETPDTNAPDYWTKYPIKAIAVNPETVTQACKSTK